MEQALDSDDRPEEGAEGHLLVVSYHFPPDGAIGGLRWAGLTKHLEPHGWKSVVVTAASQPQGGSPRGVIVQYCRPLPTMNELYRRFRVRGTRVGGGETSVDPPADAGRDDVVRGWLARLRREVGIAMALPDEGRGWILRAALLARSLIRTWRPDVVVSTGPPHSAHVATWLATRGMKARWIADLRDPWAGPISEVWKSSRGHDSAVYRKAVERMERKAIEASNGVIANSRWLADALAHKYPAKKVVWLPNGFDPQSLPADRPLPFPGLGITHLGTIYGNRDLVPVVQALGIFLDRNPAARNDGTKLRIAGTIDESRLGELKRVIRAKGLDPHVDILGVLPRSEALGILLRSRLCLVLAQGQVIEVPGKLQEAIGAGIPAVVVAPKASAGAAEAERIGAIFVDEQETGALVHVFEQAAAGELSVSDELSERVSYAGLAKAFLASVHTEWNSR